MKSQGFTLIEVTVAIGLTSLLIGTVSSLLLVALSAQRQSLATQELISQGSSMEEYMTRALRQAQKETGQGCLSSDGLNYELTHFNSGVRFINSQGQCQEFYLETGRLKELRGAQTTFLSPDDVSILAFNVALAGESQADTLQPKVTFFMDVQGKGAKAGSQARFQMQTTISQRSHDITE
ncbi:MAG: prepilin-type N-terminal cleavage/methylation domain-containing protein [bacterium]|nr:prepilin-type N-terminal cleavage/methylation domain-containing protein [bacterium]